MRQQLYLGVMEERGRRGEGGSLRGGALQTGIGGIASSSIGQTIWESESEGKVNIPFSLSQRVFLLFPAGLCESRGTKQNKQKKNKKKGQKKKNMQGITFEQKNK